MYLHGLIGWLVAGQTNNATIDPNTLFQYGVLGFFSAVLLVFARTTYKREVDRSDRLEDEVRRLNQLMADKVVGALESATKAVEEARDFMERERERMYAQPPARPARRHQPTSEG